MKLNSSGVILAILILIIMILICHTMNFFYPKNKFVDISKNNNNNNSDTPKQTDYNKIYYTSDSNEKQLCANVDQAEIPCEIVRTCKTEPAPPTPTPAPTFGLDSLSNSEIAVLYKVAYEASAREVLTRTLQDIKPEPNPWDF